MLGEPINTVETQLVVEPITGWRCWDVGTSYGETLLISPAQRTAWQAGLNTAVCLHQTSTERQHCSCGFNAYASVEDLMLSPYAGHSAYGTVALTGEVVAYECGYRGQHARVTELWVGDHVWADKLRQRYGCRVNVESGQERTDRIKLMMHAKQQAAAAANTAAALTAPPLDRKTSRRIRDLDRDGQGLPRGVEILLFALIIAAALAATIMRWSQARPDLGSLLAEGDGLMPFSYAMLPTLLFTTAATLVLVAAFSLLAWYLSQDNDVFFDCLVGSCIAALVFAFACPVLYLVSRTDAAEIRADQRIAQVMSDRGSDRSPD